MATDTRKFDETINAYYNSSYQVNKINKHISRGNQMNIFEIENHENTE